MVLLVYVTAGGGEPGELRADELLTVYARMLADAAESYAGSLNRQQGGRPRGVQLSVRVTRGRTRPAAEWDPDDRVELTDKARALLACDRAAE